jgi:hypothetical protein
MRDCTQNQGFISLPELPEEVFIAGAIIVTMTPEGKYGTHFVSESIDELPSPAVQLDLGVAVADAWQVAALTPQDES